MALFGSILDEASRAHTLFVAGGVVLARLAGAAGRRFVLVPLLAAAHLACVLAAAGAVEWGIGGLDGARIGALLLASFVFVGALGAVVFDGVLPRVGVKAPGILRDLMVGLAAVAAALITARIAGFDLSGLFATSAVLTAVIGFALQDTLGNLVSGLALQLDNSLRVGDWVQVGDRQGWITEISWRYTAFQTRDWETVIIPNSQLTKAQVVILGRRPAKPQQVRRGVRFEVDFRWSPSHVIQVVQAALRAAPVRLVATDPAPCVECDELKDGVARYVVFYWLTDLTDVVDSDVRERVFAALERAGISLAIPPQAIAATIEDEALKAQRRADDQEARAAALGAVELFRPLDEAERRWLAERLVLARFAPGEVLTRQGEESVSLFVVVSGALSVRVTADGLERDVAKLGPGDFFGEMSLLTGEPRSATVLSSGEVVTYRLDRGPAEELLGRRPELAESLADILAERRVGLQAARDGLDAQARARQVRSTAGDLVARIRSAFRLEARARQSA